jgi:SAM-dependent methyltransferase
MSIAWKIKAHFYDNLVTKTRYKELKNFLKKEEKMLDILLKDLIKNREVPISLIEVGSGTGRTLFSYMEKPEIWKHLTYLIGIDNSPAMFEIAVSKLYERKMKRKFRNIKEEIEQKYAFFCMNVLEMSKFFNNGTINTKALTDEYGENEFTSVLNPIKYEQSTKVICILLNTLGNIIKDTTETAAEARQTTINNMVKAAGKGGKIVISVFAAEAFPSEAPKLYKKIEKLTGRFDEKSFNNEKCEFKTKTYYSHWFERKEIEEMIKGAGCQNPPERKEIQGDLKGYFFICSI